jgi:hypothetical protein
MQEMESGKRGEEMKRDWNNEDYTEYRRKIARESQQLRREYARAKGMCTICCINPARPKMLTCQKCSDRIAKRSNERRMEYMNRGMCLNCGKRPPVIYKKMCKECADAHAAYLRERKEKANDRNKKQNHRA